MSTDAQAPEGNPPKGGHGRKGLRLSVLLPLVAVVAAIAVATVLIANHSSSPALPGNAHSQASSSFAGETLSP